MNPGLTLPSLIHADLHRDETLAAIVAPLREPLTYAALRTLTAATIATLRRAGIGRRDTVAVVLPNGPELAAVSIAIASGAVCAPLNPAFRADEFRFYLSDLQPAALLLATSNGGDVRAVAAKLGVRCLEVHESSDSPAGTLAFDGVDTQAAADDDPPQPDDIALLLHTSGTTARAKLVPLTHRNLCASATNVVRALALSPGDRCLNMMPLFHIHGLVASLLASLAAGASVACCPGYRDGQFLAWLDTLQPTWYTAAPAVHQAVLAELARHPEGAAANRLRFVRSASAPLPVGVLRALESVLRAPVIEAYGMTEAAHQIASNPLPPAARLPRSVGLPAGPSVAIMDPAQRLLPAGSTGEIVIRGDNVTVGYASPREANADAFAAGWFRTGDLGRIDDAGYVHITGRLKELINRAGEKVSPAEIDDALLEHPDVRVAAAFGVPHPTMGEDIAAAVVLKDGATASAPEIRAFLFGRLAEFKIPSQLVVVDALPVGATGKIARGELATQLASHLRPTFVAPRDAPEREMAALFGDVLGVPVIGAFDNFFALGGDSLRGFQLLSRIRAQWQVDVPILELFKEPTVAQLAVAMARNSKVAEIAAQSPEERGLLARRPATSSELPRRPDVRAFRGTEAVALSFAQQRLWLLDRLLPGGSAYNEGVALHLTGVLDIEALQGALNDIVRRHEVLRTRFPVVDWAPMQVIAAELAVGLDVKDLRLLPDDERVAMAQRLAREESEAPFDLERGPLLRARLLRLGDEVHWFLLTLHHIVTDGWSSSVLLRELSVLYGAHCRGEPSPLAELPVQYADYATWQREWLQGAVLDEQLRYWKRALAAMPVLELPADRPRPAATSYRGGCVAFEFGDDLTRALAELGRREGATLFMTLLAAFQVLLYRYSGQEDVVVGVPVAGRTRSELEGLIGFFVNMLVLRGDLSGEPSFREYLRQVRERALEAYTHQDVPFEKLVEELAPKRDLSRNPLVQVAINLVNIPGADLRLDGLKVERIPETNINAKLDLTLRVTEVAGSLHASFEYCADLFDRSTIERLAGHWRVLLDGIVAAPGKSIARLPLLSPAQRHQVVVEWNATAVDYPRNACIQTLFEARAARTPEAVAVVFMARQLTYRELDARANQLAHHLRGLGVGPDVRVAVAMDRSTELVVALLGILKAGSAYVPLDPSHPSERLAFMLADTEALVLLTQQHLLPQLPAGTRQTLCLDRDWPVLAGKPETDAPCVAGATDLAYITYTSGSTGQPKGVMIEHRGVCNHLHGFAQRYSVSPDDGVLQTAPIGFDMSLWQLLLPLITGARIVLPEPQAHRSGDELVELIRQTRVTILRLVPNLLSALVDTPGFAQCTSLRLVICAGEPLEAALARRFHALSDAELCNTYGPTETTFVTTLWTCRRDELRSRIPVGRPLGNMRVYLLDAMGEPVPVGTPAEVYIGGDGVARAYLNRPDLSALSFVADPFAGKPNARMYRTGDFARHGPDGTIEFLGRRDHQIKLRGVRVELGEIEAVLTRQPQVREAVVVLREDMPLDKRLVAYLVPRDPRLAVADLRAFAKRLLPDSMLPSAFVLLPALPLTQNGKVDRGALPPPVRQGSGPEQEPPRTPMEKALVQAMAEVLQLDQIDVNDNFFDLGGHSLLAVQLINRIQCALDIDLTLRQLFEAPTARALALVAAGGIRHAVP